jgi:phosphopantetheine adenylyltransferase
VTVFVESEEPYKHISSSLVRDKIRNRESISGLVHPNIEERILEIYSQK